ncbi:MAG: outer membrane lipoprotein carrier protein LolA [Phycisphaerae bacterium]
MMKSVKLAAVAVGFLLATGVAAVADERVDAAQKRIAKAWARVESVSAKFTMKQRVDTNEMSITTDGTGTLELQIKGGKTFSRMEMKTHSMQVVGGQEIKTDAEIVSVDDATFLYTLSKQQGAPPFAMKSKSQPKSWGGDQAAFDQMKQQFTLKLLDDATIEGRTCFVIEATPRNPNGATIAKMVSYFDQHSGMMIKSVSLNQSGKPTQEMAYTDLKFNKGIAPERFVFEAPDGVTVMDMSGR